MIKKILLLFLIGISFQALGQGEANVWYFGGNAGIDFNSGSPVVLTNGALDTLEGCASICTPTGNLLFYTDGTTVYNNTHTIMLNGAGLLGHSSSTQSAIIVPKPGDANIYYIFTADWEGESNGLNYSEVDMTLDGGLGAVTANKNILLHTPTTEKLTAVQHANGQDIWVITHDVVEGWWLGDSHFQSYLVTNSGVNTTPVSSVTGVNIYTYQAQTKMFTGGIKVSPDGTKLAVCHGFDGSELCDFDAATGSVSNAIVLDSRVGSYGAEFSPNGQLLYISNTDYFEVLQYNLNATDIPASELQIYSGDPNPNFGSESAALQLGPDQKIYVASNDSGYIDVITFPNVLGLGCSYIEDAVYLNGKYSKYGLPPFIQSFFYVGFDADNVCFGDSTQFNANISSAYDSILWDFGDGTTAAVESPTHTFSAPGDYDVSVAVTIGTQTTTDDRTIKIFEQPSATQPQDITVCDDNNDGLYSFNLTQQDTTILNGLNPAQFEVLYYNTLANFNNNLPLNNPNVFTNLTAYATQTIYVTVRNVDNLNCEALTTFNIQVFDTPTVGTNIPDIGLCDNTSIGTDMDGVISFDLTQNEAAILNGQLVAGYSVYYYSDSSYTTVIANPNSYQNTNAIETIYVQVVSNSNSECVAQTNFNIQVYTLPTVTTPVILNQCDDDIDGFSSFNLNEVIDEITVNAAFEIIAFYQNQTDAENGVNTITNPTTYINQTVSADTVWARVQNANGCYRVSQVNLNVSTTQIPSAFTRDIYKCDDNQDGDAYNGFTTFDFSSIDTEIQALFPAGQLLEITYYQNVADALSENNAIADITNYTNATPNIQEIYIRVDSATNNDCLGLGMHLNLHVEEVPFQVTPIVLAQCDEFNDGVESFDTTTINDQILQGQTNVNITFTDALGIVLPNPLPNPFVTSQQTINVNVTNVNSQDLNGACSVSTTIDFVIDAGVVANTIADFTACDDDNDGQFAFDVSNLETTLLNGQIGVVVVYTDQSSNVLSSPLPNPFVTTSQTITVRVESLASTICYDQTTINFIVNSQPIANPVQDDVICDNILNNGEYLFDLSNYNSQVLNGQLGTMFNISYHSSQADAEVNISPLSDSYLCSTTSETIFVRIENKDSNSCYDTTSFQIGVSYLPIASQPEDITVCDDDSNDGFEIFDLSSQNNSVLNGQIAIDNNISYHISLSDAEQSINGLNPTFQNTESPQTIFVRLENSNNTDCFTTASFDLIVNTQPVLEMETVWSICEGDSIIVTADNGYDSYLWSTGETTNAIVVTLPGDYWVIASNIYGGLVCEATKNVEVVVSNIATITDIVTQDWTQNNNSIIVEVEGEGDYEFSLDGVVYQDSNVFSNLDIDDYTVFVRDKKGCGIVSDDVYLLYYPNYFTPNGDTINDTWQIINSNKERDNVIQIYDRYGKLLKQLAPQSPGWDGTFNGQILPTNDYWFVLYRQNGKTYKGHFTLKR